MSDKLRYGGAGNMVRRIDGAGAVTVDSYDPPGREVAETNPVSGTSLITYSATAPVAQQDPQGNVTRSSFDPAGRLVQSTDPLSGTVQDQYDNAGNTTAITSGDASGATTVQTRQYDAQHHVISATVSGPGLVPQTTQTAYDADGHVAAVLQPNGDSIGEYYDLVNQHLETFVVSAGGGTSTRDEHDYYDAAGNVSLTLDADERLHTSTLDGANREVQSTDTYTYTPALTTSVSYDPDGTALLRTTQTAGLTQTATYTQAVNAADWPITTTDILTSGQKLATAYGYDGAGQPRTQTILNGVTPITALNAEGLVTATSESLGGTPYSSTFGYNADDRPLTKSHGDSTQDKLTG